MEAKCLQMELESGTLLGAQFPLWVEPIITNVQKESLKEACSNLSSSGATSRGTSVAMKWGN